MIYLPAIGFGVLVIGLRLIMLWRNLKGTKSIFFESLGVIAIGIVAWLSGTLVSSDTILQNTGQAIMILGFISLVQWAIQTCRSTLRQLKFGALISTLLGVILIAVYLTWVTNVWRSALMWEIIGLIGLFFSFVGAVLLAFKTVKSQNQIIEEYSPRIPVGGPPGSDEYKQSVLKFPIVQATLRQSKYTKNGLLILAAGFILQFAAALALLLIKP